MAVLIKDKVTKEYWGEKLVGKEHFEFSNSKSTYINGILIKNENIRYFQKLTAGSPIAEFTIFLTIFQILIQRYFEEVKPIYSKGITEKTDKSLLFDFNEIGNKRFKEYLGEVKKEVQQAFRHADYKELISEKYPLEQYAMFRFSYGESFHANSYKNPFSLIIKQVQDIGFELSIQFSENFTNQSIVTHFLRNFHEWIIQLNDYLEKPVATIPLLNAKEKNELLNKFNSTFLKPSEYHSLSHLFEESATLYSDQVALIDGRESLTYSELNEKSNQFAHFLTQTYNIRSNDLVGLKLDRNQDLIISLIGILKTGAAYVPIDINYPKDRISYIENDSKCKLVVDRMVLEQFKKPSADVLF